MELHGRVPDFSREPERALVLVREPEQAQVRAGPERAQELERVLRRQGFRGP